MAELLIVEDDEVIGGVLTSSLISHGHQVRWARTGREARALLADRGVDLVLLDLGLPDADGLGLCRSIRSEHDAVVVVVLTARDEEIDVVLGLEAGADDYLTKPFRLAELIARIHAHLRRAGSLDSQRSVVGALTVDHSSRRAFLADTELALRAKEFDLLARLAIEPGKAIGRAQLMAQVWDPHWFGSTKTLDVHISWLRAKLGTAAAAAGVRAPQVVTVRAYGYRMDAIDPPAVDDGTSRTAPTGGPAR